MAGAGNDDGGASVLIRAGRLTRRGFTAGAMLAATGDSIWSRAAAADAKYPERPVRVIVPYGQGTIADLTVRLVGEKLGLNLGQRFVVENLPGASGAAAARAVLQAHADGYTITLLTSSTAISVPLFKRLGFDPLKDFVPISSVGFFDCVFVSNAASELRTMEGFLKAANEKPGTLNVGTVNVGSMQHLSAELLKSLSGANFVIIPFRTPAEAIQALLRDDIQLVVDFPTALHAALAEHKLHPVAATGPVSAKSLGGIPTVAQAGVPGYEATSWNALYAPSGTPDEPIEILNAALHEAVADPEIKRRAAEFGVGIRPGTPAEADARMRGDIAKWAKLIAHANIPQQ
jgi:tripartite-type tricarboxylate transporter receptor subunit TctC